MYSMKSKIVKCLLEHGADPNAEFNGYSAWSNALYHVDKDAFRTLTRRDDSATHGLQAVEVMKLLLAYGAAKKASYTLTSGETSAAEVVRSAISNLDDKFPEEVRDGLREVLVIIEDDESDRDRASQAVAATKGDNGEDHIAAASFADSPEAEPQSTSFSHKPSLSQRIKALLLKRRR